MIALCLWRSNSQSWDRMSISITFPKRYNDSLQFRSLRVFCSTKTNKYMDEKYGISCQNGYSEVTRLKMSTESHNSKDRSICFFGKWPQQNPSTNSPKDIFMALTVLNILNCHILSNIQVWINFSQVIMNGSLKSEMSSSNNLNTLKHSRSKIRTLIQNGGY